MASRNFPDWLSAYVQYANHTEAPRLMHFFSGVWALASVLRRKVWMDQVYFRWFPGFYIIFVAPPGVVAKSTTVDIAADLVRDVPGINFGPDSVTWESLAKTFANSCEQFEFEEAWHPMSAVNLVSSEFGNLIDFHNKAMINFFITLWDGRKQFEKETKMSGNDSIDAPWINMIACTTPGWIADNMTQTTIGGGFTSRCIFVYAEKKEKYVAYLDEQVPRNLDENRIKLVQDLEYMSLNLTGPFTLSQEAREWGKDWYRRLWEEQATSAHEEWEKGYIARKQTHLHKMAMVLSISRSDSKIISPDDMQLAEIMLKEAEDNSALVFAKVGLSQSAVQIERLMEFIQRQGSVPYQEAYRVIHYQFPDHKDFEGVLAGLIRSGYVTLEQRGPSLYISWLNK